MVSESSMSVKLVLMSDHTMIRGLEELHCSKVGLRGYNILPYIYIYINLHDFTLNFKRNASSEERSRL